MNYSKDELKENQNKFLKLKTAQFLKIINLTNSDINSNYKFNPFNTVFILNLTLLQIKSKF